MFSEDTYFREFKRIRNHFRKYDPHNLIERCLVYANGGVTAKEKVQRHPWLMMLLIKWILLDDNFEVRNRPVITDDRFHKLIQSTLDLSTYARLPNEFDHVTLFFRALANQQFLYQRDFDSGMLARQMMFFGEFPQGHKLRVKFQQNFNLNIDEFLSFSFILLVRYLVDKRLDISIDWFKPLRLPDIETKAFHFLEALSGSDAQLSGFFRSDYGSKRWASEYYEQTPLIRKPLIKIGSNYYMVHPNIVFRSLEHFVHDYFRKTDALAFMRYFGKIFERYLDDSLKYSKLTYITEDALKESKSEGNLVDFVISEHGRMVFVEAKGIAGDDRFMTSSTSEYIQRQTEKSALKAIKQGLEVNEWYHTAKGTDSINFLLVVTAKEVALGTGKKFRDTIASNKVDDLYASYPNSGKLPLENVFFVSVETFDRLCHLLSLGDKSLLEILEHARQVDTLNPMGRFYFDQYLDEMKLGRGRPKFLSDKIETEMEKLHRLVEREIP